MYSERFSSDSYFKNSIQSVWHSQMAQGDRSLIVPDAATDVIVKYGGGRLEIVFCGTMTNAKMITAEKEMQYWGLRFNPGHGSLFFDFPIQSSNNELIDISNNFERSIISDLMIDPVANSLLIEKEITKNLLKKIDENSYVRSIRAIQQLESLSFGSIEKHAQQIGVSRRQLNRIFKSYFGYSARESSRMFKFKKMISYLSANPQVSLSELALAAGFYDQSDMNNCVKDLCKMTPQALMSHLSNT